MYHGVFATASDHERVAGDVFGWHPVCAGRASRTAGVGVLVVGVGAGVGVLVMVDLSATMAGVDSVHERREKGMTEGIRCGCAGMGGRSRTHTTISEVPAPT